MISFTVNGEEHRFDGDETMPLLWYLRDVADLTGAKFGCGAGLCGACTVHIDGMAMRSCITPLAAAKGKQVTTIEGLSDDGSHPVQQAWAKHQVPQCGYCQPGQIMQASALLASNPTPSSEEIDQAMRGNICRCGTYTRIKAAITDLAEPAA
ncbi:MAG: (2Fe-2S)-binding protein [Congregibacter sp.]